MSSAGSLTLFVFDRLAWPGGAGFCRWFRCHSTRQAAI